MLLTLTLTRPPATDLGYLLHKHPGKLQSFALSFGRAHVFYPEATPDRCSACLLLDVDPVGIVRGTSPDQAFLLEQYVNDRPYAASSFLSVAIAQVFGTAMAGICNARPELVGEKLPLTATLDVVPARAGGEGLLRQLFEPLGYALELERLPLDATFPEWGDSPYFRLALTNTVTLSDLLAHLYVLVPVLSGHKHYFVGEDEVEKLLAKGREWLPAHPARDEIARRYLKHRPGLFREALARLAVGEADADPEAADAEAAEVAAPTLNQQRHAAVAAALREAGARRVLDLGCGEGKLLRALAQDEQFAELVGVDVSLRALEIAERRLKPDASGRVQLLHGSLLYRDRRIEGFDAAAVVEVVEHLDPPRLAAFERAVWEFARPRVVVLTTPNRDYNAAWPSLPAGAVRHADHRFEWTRDEFRAWAGPLAKRAGYAVSYRPVGAEHPELGPPTQMAVFERAT